MSDIYLIVIIQEKNWRSQNFDFLSVKIVSPGRFWGVPPHEDIIEISFLVST